MLCVNDIKEEIFKKVDTLLKELFRQPNMHTSLNTAEESILRLLAEKQTLPVEELKKYLEMDAYKISRTLKALETYDKEKKAPLINSDCDPKDKRRKIVSVTKDGLKILKDELDKRKKRLECLFGDLEETELETLLGLVNKMLTHIVLQRVK